MSYSRSVPRMLHDEHLVTLATLDRIERHILARRNPPAAGDAETERLFRRIRVEFGADVDRHFEFEEGALFPFLAESGEGTIGDVLSGEHEALREVIGELVAELPADGAAITPETWVRLRRLGGELVERMASHVQKEEMALLPLLELRLDIDTDCDLAARAGE